MLLTHMILKINVKQCSIYIYIYIPCMTNVDDYFRYQTKQKHKFHNSVKYANI